MSVINKLSSSLHRKDQIPNQELARQIADKSDKAAVNELVENLKNKKQIVQGDCIKVLYEIGEIKPLLIAPYAKEFIALLNHKNNRLQWGAMTALDTIALENPKLIYSVLPKILLAANKGTVITKDKAVSILVKICSVKQYSSSVFPLLIEELLNSPTNQFPSYAEKTLPFVNDKNRNLFIKTLSGRLSKIEPETKRKRVEKVLKKVSSI